MKFWIKAKKPVIGWWSISVVPRGRRISSKWSTSQVYNDMPGMYMYLQQLQCVLRAT